MQNAPDDAHSLRALIFDFDGVIIDTELPLFRVWSEIFEAHGHTLDRTLWQTIIGTQNGFDPHAELEQRIGRALDRASLRAQRLARFDVLMKDARILDGVEALLNTARTRGLKTAVASSSSRDWVEGFLERFELRARFDHVECWEPGLRSKPAPDLYLRALDALNVRAAETIAIEDSPNGARAAKDAGIFCIVVPCELTRELEFPAVGQRLDSLAGFELPELISR